MAKIHDFLPMLLCDVLCLEDLKMNERSKIFRSFGCFSKSCILCARIVAKLRDSNGFHNYVIDDNTATMKLSIFEQRTTFQSILRLEDEVDIFERYSCEQSRQEIAECLRRILCQTKKQINFSNIPIGSKVMVLGKLKMFRGHVTMQAVSIFWDERITPLIEMEFKNILIDWYKNKYALNHSK